MDEITPQSLGALIALFERAVGLYASLIGINAYDQPGVEEGKRVAKDLIDLSLRIQSLINTHRNEIFTTISIANILKIEGKKVLIYKILKHLNANGKVQKIDTSNSFSAEYRAKT